MPRTTLASLLERNARHTTGLRADYFDDVREAQRPPVVSVCCSDSRVSQEGMWAVDEPGWLFTPSTIGNQVWDLVDGERVVDGSLLYPVRHTDSKVTVVVGHTGCGAITAALEATRTGAGDEPPGIRKWIELLVPIVEDWQIEHPTASSELDDDALVNRVVERHVDRQIDFLQEAPEIPADEDLYGFVYDFHNRYGTVPGRAYLTNANGVTDVQALRDQVPEDYREHVKRLETTE